MIVPAFTGMARAFVSHVDTVEPGVGEYTVQNWSIAPIRASNAGSMSRT
jgi:hypothetical protein